MTQAVDRLNETLPYQDEGCELSPSCLKCPLERCRFDAPGAWQRQARLGRDQRVVARRRQGETISSLARSFGVCERTIYRILRRWRHG